jgi:hypothetical protein
MLRVKQKNETAINMLHLAKYPENMPVYVQTYIFVRTSLKKVGPHSQLTMQFCLGERIQLVALHFVCAAFETSAGNQNYELNIQYVPKYTVLKCDTDARVSVLYILAHTVYTCT